MPVHEHLAPLPGFLRRHPWASGLTTILIFGIGAAVFLLTRPKTPTYITAVATRGNLMQTVEAVGTVISEKDLELQFPVSGIVGQVFVQEGDHVRVGQKLAALRSASLAADSASALARVKSAEAELRALAEGTRPEDLAIAEAEVANKRAALEAAQETLAAAQLKLAALRDEAATSLEGHILTSKSSAEEQLSTAETAFAKSGKALVLHLGFCRMDLVEMWYRQVSEGSRRLLASNHSIHRDKPLDRDRDEFLPNLAVVIR